MNLNETQSKQKYIFLLKFITDFNHQITKISSSLNQE